MKPRWRSAPASSAVAPASRSSSTARPSSRARSDVIALEVVDAAEQRARLALDLDVVLRDASASASTASRSVDARGVVAHLDRAPQRGSASAAAPRAASSASSDEQADRPRRVPHDQPLAAGLPGPLGRGGEVADRVGADRGAARRRPGRARPRARRRWRCGSARSSKHVGECCRDRRGDAGVALRPRRLGQHLVRRLAHGVAAELPPPAVASARKPFESRLVDDRRVERLVHLLRRTARAT